VGAKGKRAIEWVGLFERAESLSLSHVNIINQPFTVGGGMGWSLDPFTPYPQNRDDQLAVAISLSIVTGKVASSAISKHLPMNGVFGKLYLNCHLFSH